MLEKLNIIKSLKKGVDHLGKTGVIDKIQDELEKLDKNKKKSLV